MVAVPACLSSSNSGGDPPAPTPVAVPANANPGESPPSMEKPKDPATQIIVGVDAEDFAAAGYQLTHYEVLATIDGVVLAQKTFDTEAGPLFPHEVRLVAPKDKPGATVQITVTAHMNDAIVATRRTTTHFVAGATKLAYALLEVRCNTFAIGGGGTRPGPTCAPTGETCIAGKCRSDVVAELPDYAADWSANPPSACGTGIAEVVVGKGENDFAPIASGETLAVDCGPQGGNHVWMALRMKSLRQVGTVTTISAMQPASAGGKSVTPTAFAASWGPADGGGCELDGLRFQLDVAGAAIQDFLGKPLDITVNTRDKAGHDITSVVHVQVAATRTGMYCY
jgi:hypothetical protein